jgi:outer membrane protein assembly factor BamB
LFRTKKFKNEGISTTHHGVVYYKTDWRIQTNGAVRGAIIETDSTLYFTSADSHVYASTLDGEILWKYKGRNSFSNGVAIATDMLFAMDRKGIVYALHRKSGNLQWSYTPETVKRDTDFISWDYQDASPQRYQNKIIVAAPNGIVYALDLNGKVVWKFKTNGKLSATPLVNQDDLYIPSHDGYVYKLDAVSGKLIAKFKTEGATLNSIASGWDRIGIYTAPMLEGNNLLVGSRDGFLYCIDAQTMKEKWRHAYGSVWCMSLTVENGKVYSGWSDTKCLAAFDIETGKEVWKTVVGSLIFSKPIINGDQVIVGSADHTLYWMNKHTGEIQNTYALQASIYSHPTIVNNHVYVGCDKGIMYSISTASKPLKVVYQPNPAADLLPFTIDEEIAPYLVQKGFEQIASPQALADFLTARIEDAIPSSVVFAYGYLPKEVLKDDLIINYLKCGGKVVWLGGVVNLHQFDSLLNYKGTDVTIGSALLGVDFQEPIESGKYTSYATQLGLNIGFPSFSTMVYANTLTRDVTPLAYDELNRVSAWYKIFNQHKRGGFYSVRSWGYHEPIQLDDLQLIHKVATYGLE